MSTIDGGSGGVAVLDEPVAPEPAPEENDKRKKLLIWLGIILALLLLVLSLLAWYLINRKPLSSLPIITAEAMPTYQSSIYGVDKPIGVAVSADGSRIYVTQSGGKRTTLMFDADGNLLKTLAVPKDSKGRATAHLPGYVAVDPTNGDVVVTDEFAKAIYVYDGEGNYRRTVTPVGLTGSWVPLGVTFTPQGDLVVTEIGGKNHRVLVLDQFDRVTRTIVPTDTPLSFPNGVAVDNGGNVFVSDGNNGRMLAFNADGAVIGSAERGIGEGDLGLPRGVATDSGDRVYVVDTVNHLVKAYKLGSDGANRISFIGTFGDEGIADGQFEYPNGIATDSRSTIYVTDRENGRVQVWS
jgi:DNA-binding beta-propeller fold protein YncE